LNLTVQFEQMTAKPQEQLSEHSRQLVFGILNNFWYPLRNVSNARRYGDPKLTQQSPDSQSARFHSPEASSAQAQQCNAIPAEEHGPRAFAQWRRAAARHRACGQHREAGHAARAGIRGV
jgi:hypothetical protein